VLLHISVRRFGSVWFAFACFCHIALRAAAAQTPVILISIDTLRADHLSAYGYRKIQTPNIDALARGGTLFTACDAQIPLTLPSHTSLFTSTYPFENQVEENAEQIPSSAVTLASALQSHGYRTAAFIGSVFLERELGLDKGFDEYDSPFHFAAFSPLSGSMFFAGASQNKYSVRDRRDGALVKRAALQWLSANRGQSVFVFLHFFDLHKPYTRPGYDSEIEYVDSVLGSLRQALVDDGWWDRSLVILLADHGEGLDEHGETSHGYFIYESTLWVPLIIHWPAGALGHAERVAQPVGLIDVAPTILDFLHIEAPASFEGTSLLGPVDSRAVYAETLHTHDSFGWAPLRSVRMGPYKYIEAPRPELYNLDNDPREQSNLLGKNPDEAQALRDRLSKLLALYAPKQPTTRRDTSEQTRALLRSLGYLSAGPQAKLEVSGPDPKDRLPEFRNYEKALDLISDGKLEPAIAILRALLTKDPDNTLARRDLGAAYLDHHDNRQARLCFEQVLAVAPDDYMAQYELGIADERLGLMQEARTHLEAACKSFPESSQCRKALDSLDRKNK